LNIYDEAIAEAMEEEFPGLSARFPPESIELIRMDDNIPPRKWFVHGMVPKGDLTLISGKKGFGKTWFLMQLLQAVSFEEMFLGCQTELATSLFWPSEIDKTGLHERAQKLGEHSRNSFVMFSAIPRGKDLLELLPQLIKRYEFEVIAIDMLQSCIDMEADASRYEIGHFLLSLRQIAMQTGISIIGTWHETKASNDDPLMSLMGSTAIGAQAGSIITIRKKDRADIGLDILINGNHAEAQTIHATFENCRFNVSEKYDDGGAYVAAADKLILEALQNRPDGVAVTTLAGSIGKTPNGVRTALYRLAGRGLAENRNKQWFAVDHTKPYQTILSTV
jgi:hypothetical protein